MIRVPVGPPATPVAITGCPSARSAWATFTPLAAGHRGLLHGAVAAAAEPEVGHGEGLVDGGVEGDGDDHLTSRQSIAHSEQQHDGGDEDGDPDEQGQGYPRAEVSTLRPRIGHRSR